MMSALQENTTHVVVQYCRQTENDKLLVDLVVRSWVFYSSTIEKWICRYPQPKDAIHVIKWVRDCLPPKEDFYEYNVHIIKEAGSYKIGLKYLKDSYTTAEIKSIDGDADIDYDSEDPGNPRIYSQKDVQKILSMSKKMSKEKSPVHDGPSNRKSKQAVQVLNKSIKYAEEKSPNDDGSSNRKSEKKQGVKVSNKSIKYAKEKSPIDDGSSNRKSKQDVLVSNKSIEYAKEKSPIDDGSSNRKSKQDVLVSNKSIEYAKEKSPIDDGSSNRKSKQAVLVSNKSIKYAKEKSPIDDGSSNRKSKQDVLVSNKSIEYAKEKSPIDDGSSNRKSKQAVLVSNKSIEYAKEKSPSDDGSSNRKSKQAVLVSNKSIEYAKEKSPSDDGPGDKKASAATESAERSSESSASSDDAINRSYISDSSIEAESDTEVINNEVRDSSSDETAGVRSPPKAEISISARRISLPSREMSPLRQVDESHDIVANTPSSVTHKGTVAKPDKTAGVQSPRRAVASSSKDNRIRSSTLRMSSRRQSNREHPVVASLSDLKDLEERIYKKIHKTKSSILYNLSKIYRVVKANNVTGNDASRDEEASVETVLDMRFPLENIVDFESFEEKLKDADAKTVMRKYMSLFSCGTTPQEDIASILPELIRKKVQLLFSGSGKVQKGKAKRNFSATETYSCMEEILMKKYRGKFSRKQIRSHTGVWLSRAGDREGGKIEREVKAAAERAKRTGK